MYIIILFNQPPFQFTSLFHIVALQTLPEKTPCSCIHFYVHTTSDIEISIIFCIIFSPKLFMFFILLQFSIWISVSLYWKKSIEVSLWILWHQIYLSNLSTKIENSKVYPPVRTKQNKNSFLWYFKLTCFWELKITY